MTENEKEITPDSQETGSADNPTSSPLLAGAKASGRLRWLVKSLTPPLLIIASGAAVILGLGVAQKSGWITAGGGNASGAGHASAKAENVRYICPMMCTPPQTEPGRCPVCAMELVPATSSEGETDGLSIQVDAVARRVANIRTVAVKAVPLTKTIRAIGELSYDEGSLKTIAAYIDGRLEKLYADYTGAVVEKGDHLALVYSPKLYSSQVELLVAKRAVEQSRSTVTGTTALSGRGLYSSARERLIEFGMTAAQIAALEQANEANSRLHLCAPISGTVIEKLAVEGQYVKTGQAIYRLADLSTVWLMLMLFPQDAAAIRYGQEVEATVQSIPGRTFRGRVAFIDPTVDPKTRTVGVRVVMSNEEGLLRVGDYAKAKVSVRVSGSGGPLAEVYDAELADKWISPRHPHVIESSHGTCRECGIELVPAARFGFASQPIEGGEALVVPRNAVLMAGQSSVVYVEMEPGRFEIRRVVLGPSSGEEIAILEGVEEGEQVAYSGNFLIDSQMQLAGHPSLIDPTKVQPAGDMDEAKSAELIAALEKLSPEDRALAESQRICPVTEMPLGSMGPPIKVDVEGTPVLICCEGCRVSLLAEPKKHLARLKTSRTAGESSPEALSTDTPPIGAMAIVDSGMNLPSMATMTLAESENLPTEDRSSTARDEIDETVSALESLSPDDRAAARKQRICPVTGMPLGSMGTPIRVDVHGRAVFICCEGCRESLLAEPAKYLANLSKEVAR